MATLRASLASHAAKDGSGDKIYGSEVDENPYVIADILDGTTSTPLGQAGDITVANGYGLVVGHTAQVAAGGTTFEMQVLGTAAADSGLGVVGFSATAATAPIISFGRSKAAAIGTYTIVADNDILGTINWAAADGVDLATIVASLSVEVDDATPAADTVGAAMVIKTSAAEGTITERLRIAGDGTIVAAVPDVTIFDDSNNADVSVKIGTSATECLTIQVLNGAANKSAESVNIVSSTAAAGANAGQITIGVDDATILTIDDGGINAILGATTPAAVAATTVTTSGIVSVDATTESTSTTTGSIHTDGGVGIAKDLILSATSTIFVGDTANANMITGLTINQGANDNQLLALKSSDIDTGLTSTAIVTQETTDVFVIQKTTAAAGGVRMQATMEDTAGQPVVLQFVSYGGTAGTTKTNAGALGLVDTYVSEHNGANALADITADGNIASWRCRVSGADVARMVLDEDGELHLTNTTLVALTDRERDAHIARAFSLMRHKAGAPGLVRSKYDEEVVYDEQYLVDSGILGDTVANGGLWNIGRHVIHLNDGLWQVYSKFREAFERLEQQTGLKLLET